VPGTPNHVGLLIAWEQQPPPAENGDAMGTDRQDAPPPATHCEWCGADFESDTAPPPPRKATTTAPESAHGEPATHCEWCGAEYPVPGEDD
jgi:hypothetical protein